MFSRFTVSPRAVASSFLVVFAFLATALTAGAASITASAGGATPDQTVQLMQYFPGTLTIGVGDTVTWTMNATEPHTISFGKPPFPPGSDQAFAPAGGNSFDGTNFVNSGLLFAANAAPPGAATKFSLTFTQPGTFTYSCLIHPNMTGKVVVQPAGTAYPPSQASYQATNDPVYTAAISAGQSSIATQKVTTKKNPDGSTTYVMAAGWGDGKSYAVLRFGANNLTIHASDSVQWSQQDPNEVHTVTFLNNGQDVPFLLPNNTTNPVAVRPAGGTTYSGSGFFNSGLLLPVGTPPQVGPSSYTLKFDRPGTYNYLCILHDDQGMKGTLTVLGATAALPRTGGIPESAGLGVGLIGLLLVGSGLFLKRRAQA
ncbi:MAG TPA: plastocyanin/azurin family copper-binding protein [Chloroflexota bacterium]|nr:plastocyanin/azurin family copper-binding protein [Chloroflexota bacterium]